MDMLFSFVIIAATLLVALVTGLLFSFTTVVMPGIKQLDDRQFVKAFQVMDGVIQRNDPRFVFVWMGSVLAIVTGAILGLWVLSSPIRFVPAAIAALYILGVQAPTLTVNVPLNNALQKVDSVHGDNKELREARKVFEEKWNRWNRRRTIVAIGTTTALLLFLLVV